MKIEMDRKVMMELNDLERKYLIEILNYIIKNLANYANEKKFAQELKQELEK